MNAVRKSCVTCFQEAAPQSRSASEDGSRKELLSGASTNVMKEVNHPTFATASFGLEN